MKLERLVIENFRQYFGRQRIEFARDPQRRVTVIHGINGAGKTSLFLAINWCLYGERVEDVKVIDNVGELMSKEAVQRAEPGESVRTLVELVFLHDGERYVVRRLMEGTKQKDGTVLFGSTDEFAMMRTRRDGEAEKVHNPVGMMNVILPVNVREYFLFDGEKIDNFAKPEAAEQVKQAIYLVLKLEILERAQRHLKTAAQDYRRELKQITTDELRDLIEREEQVHETREQASEQMSRLNLEITSARQKITEIDQRLREAQGSQVLQERRDNLEWELKQREDERDELLNQIRDLATSSYFMLAGSVISNARQVLDQKRERGEIPSSIRQQFVHDLLERMICICGRPISDGSAEHQRLLKVLEHSMPGSLEDDVLDTNAILMSFDMRIQEQRAELSKAMNRHAQLVDITRVLETQLDDVGKQLRGSPLEQVGELERRREEFVADIDSGNVEVGSLSNRLQSIDEELAQLKKAITNARKDERRVRLLTQKLDLAQQSVQAIEEMHGAFADDMRQRIEEKTKEIFKLLVWKESHFRDVRLEPNYNLEVIDRYGLSARPELSAGERQVLSLSFITAMSRLSEEEAPLVMDTPFGRLSSQHRNNITKHLPELADQLVLFVTDEELRDQAQANLQPRIGSEYRLEFDHATSCTQIVEVRT